MKNETGEMVRRTWRPGRKPTAEQRKQMQALAAMPDDQIDTSDIPELPASSWKNAVRNPYLRFLKTPVTMRVDADVLRWLKDAGAGYQTRANAILRESMEKAFREKMATQKRKPAKTAAVSRKPATRKIAAKRRAA
jgi:uncharacterized protein (DUF4415 family)